MVGLGPSEHYVGLYLLKPCSARDQDELRSSGTVIKSLTLTVSKHKSRPASHVTRTDQSAHEDRVDLPAGPAGRQNRCRGDLIQATHMHRAIKSTQPGWWC